MFHLISLVGSGISYLINRREDKEKTEEHTDTQDTEDPVQTDSLLDPGLECEDETQTDSAVPQESVNEAEEKSQKVEESVSLLDDERSILEERVRELEELLCEREREYERKQEVTLAKSEEKHKQVMESFVQMEKQETYLKSRMHTLKNTFQELSHLLTLKETECTDATTLYEREMNLRKRLESEEKQKEEKFYKKTRYLRAERKVVEMKYDKLMESKTKLEMFKSRMSSDMRLLQDARMELDEKLSLTRIGNNEMKRSKQNEEGTSLKECEREKEPHMTSTNRKELLQGIQARCKGYYREMMEFQENLKMDEVNYEVNVQRELVQQLERELSESYNKCEELKREREKDKEHNSVLKCDQTTSTDLMELAQPVDEYIAQLENETSDLRPRVMTLQDSLLEQSILLAEKHREYEIIQEKHKLLKDMIHFMETYARKQKRSLNQQIVSLKEALQEYKLKYRVEMDLHHNKEGLLSRLTDDNLVLKQEIIKLSNDLSDLQLTLEQTTQELEQKTQQITQIQTDWNALCDEIVAKDSEDRFRAHQLLKVQYSEMKQQHDKLEEGIAQLKEAYSTLESQYEELKQQHGSQMECKCKQEQEQESSSHTEESGSERERRQNQYDLLKARCQQLEESLQECQELLKILSPDL